MYSPALFFLGVAWYSSIKRKNIFNSFYKWMLLPSVLIFGMTVWTLTSGLRFSGATEAIVMGFFFVLVTIISYVGCKLYFTRMHNYYDDHGTSEPQSEADYLEHTYRMLEYDNTVAYHYDARMNFYIAGNLIWSAGETLFIKGDIKPFVASLQDYYKYFKDFGMGYDSMNVDSLEVFKMYQI